MTTDFGRPGISPRIVLGALIIKHKEKLDDRGVISAIQETAHAVIGNGTNWWPIANSKGSLDLPLVASTMVSSAFKVFRA